MNADPEPRDQPVRSSSRTRTRRSRRPSSAASRSTAGPRGSRASLSGRTIGRYQILGQLGRGGMGSVWKATDTLLGRTVALKFLPESTADSVTARRRFLREAKAASSLDHAGIATVYDAGELEGRLFIAVAHVDGETLAEVAARGPQPAGEAVRIVAAAAEALAHAHEHGVLHRDVTARNIMLSRDGRVIVVDFGLATHRGATRLTLTGAPLGTVAYMAPEVAQGRKADERSDLYGLGVVLYELLTGTLPFMADRSEALIYAAVHQPPEPPSRRAPDIPRVLDRVVLKLLAKDPAGRHQRARDLASELLSLPRKWERDTGGGTWPDGHPSRARPAQSRVQASKLPLEKYLAMLPFRDLSSPGSGSQGQVFARGLAEVVSAGLAKIPGVQVIPPAATGGAVGGQGDLRRVARELGANLMLCGSVQRSGGKVRVAYSLVDPAQGVQIAGDTVDGRAGDLLALEDQLVLSVVRALRLQAEPSPPSPVGTVSDPAAHEHFLQALGYLQRHENEASVDGAIGILEKLLASEGEKALLHAALGRAYLSKYKLTFEREWQAKAMASCVRALELDPRSPEVMVTLGNARSAMGRYARAIRDYRRALQLRPDDPDALIGMGEAHEHLGQMRQAEEASRAAIALRPGHWAAHNQLGTVLFDQGRYAEALVPWRRVVELSPDNTRGHLNLGSAYYRMGRFDDAIAAFRRSLETQPNASAYSNLGTVYFYLGSFAEAAGMFERAVALRPKAPRMWGNLGDAYRWAPALREKAPAAFDRAIALMRDFLKLNPNQAEGWAWLADWLAKRGEKREAVRAIQRVSKLGKHDVDLLVVAARVHYLVGQRAKALELFERAVRRGYGVAELEREPELTSLRQDREFRKILKEGRVEAKGR